MRKLEGKVAIIIRISIGIGEGIARTFVRYGAKAVLAARGEKVLQMAEELRSQGYEAIGVQTDVSDEKSVEHLVQTAISAYGTVDVLVNNAGICTLEDFGASDNVIRDRHIDINIKGVWNVTKAGFALYERKKGRKDCGDELGDRLYGGGSRGGSLCDDEGGSDRFYPRHGQRSGGL